ncbi:MAG: STN domain-containing protein, partial [Gemmatimonadales bacterium]
MRSRVLSVLWLVAGISSGDAADAWSQELAARGPRFLAAWAPEGRVVDASNSAPLRRRVSLDLTGVKADEALKAIITAAHLEIAFNPALLPAERMVSLHVRDITVAAALTEVLLDTGVDVTVSRDGSLTLAHRVAGTAPSVSDSGV